MAKRIYQAVDGNWTNTANWSGGVNPANGDDVYIMQGTFDIVTNVTATGVSLNSLTIGAGFTGTIGTTAAPLQIGYATGYFGLPGGGGKQNGSGRVIVDAGAVQFLAYVLSTGTSPKDIGQESLRLLGTHASNKMVVQGGVVGFCTNTVADVGTLLEMDVVNGAQLNTGAGVTWTTANVSDRSILTTQSGGGTTLSVSNSAKAIISGTTLVATVNCNGNIVYNVRPAAGNLITTANLYADGTLDFRQNPATGNIATLNHYEGGSWLNNDAVPNHITATSWVRIGGGDVTLK